ncbi:oxygenase MpaB family protein [Nocardia wallacei]|uniref:oxygenase MpaB family protein n=1 Tax=Nocardia wallacei TaxID=480035 RepID=UPI0024579400|nr:oxygenase MpaB family protein [Nocardia wallacei]
MGIPTTDTDADARIDRLWEMPLSPWLDVGDPLAEAVVATMRARRQPMADPLPRIRRLAADGDRACRDFLRDIETPPEWADFTRMRLGGAMAYRHFGQYIVAVGHGALMTTFSSPDSAYILTRTNRLERDVVRRLIESSDLFFGVLDADELRPGGRAWETCVRVRLMHTMVRLRLAATAWPLPGTPINALQTAAGPLFFGAMMLDRLRSLGASISPGERDGFYLIWRYVTRLLGVPRELLGDTAAEQSVLDARILPYTFDPDDNSRRLAGVALTGLSRMPMARLLPRTGHEVMARYLLGSDHADAMGIPAHRLGSAVMVVLALGLKPYGFVQRLPVVAPRLERFGRRCLQDLRNSA